MISEEKMVLLTFIILQILAIPYIVNFATKER